MADLERARLADAGGGAAHAVVAPRIPLRAWWTMLRISIEERLVYRGDFALGTLHGRSILFPT